MSSHPNIYISASFFVGEGADWLAEKINNFEASLDCQVASEDDETAIDGNFTEGYITVFYYLTYGWGDSLSHEEFKTRWDAFVIKIQDYCVSNSFGLPEFRLGANFY